jgi:hypothetical protein
MSVVPPIGAMCLGIVIGWLVRFFIWRFETFSPSVLSSVISILLGGGITRFLSADPNVWWFYPIGLLVGFVVYQVIATNEVRRRTATTDKEISENERKAQESTVPVGGTPEKTGKEAPTEQKEPAAKAACGGGGVHGGWHNHEPLYAPRRDDV